MHRSAHDLRKRHGQKKKRQSDRYADRSGVDEHRTQRRHVEARLAAHLGESPAPYEDVEHRDVDDSVEDPFRTQDRVLQRHAHEPRVGEDRREAQHRTRARAAARGQERKRHERRVGREGYGESGAEAPQHRRVERTLEDVDYETRRNDEYENVDYALYGGLVEEAQPAAQRADAHEGEKHSHLRRDRREIVKRGSHWMADFTGPKLSRCSGHGPSLARAARCEGVGYPLC